MKKCILIDVVNETITPVEIENGIDPIYKQLDCSTFEVVNIDGENDIYVDEEGLLNLTPSSKFFTFEGGHQPFAGHGLVMGFDDETGDSKDTTLTVEFIKSKVKFHTLDQVRRMV